MRVAISTTFVKQMISMLLQSFISAIKKYPTLDLFFVSMFFKTGYHYPDYKPEIVIFIKTYQLVVKRFEKKTGSINSKF